MRQHDDSDTDQTEHRVSDMSRRGFLQSGSTAVGGSLLGAGLADQASDTASASTTPSASAADFAAIRQNWRDIVTGYNPDRSDPYIDKRVTWIENVTSNILESYNTTDSNKVFDNVNMDEGGLQVRQTFDRLRWMGWAYKTEPSSYYNDTSLRDKIIDGMKQVYDEGYYDENSDVGGIWDKLASPNRLIHLTMLLYEDLSPKWRSNFAAAVQHHNGFLSVAPNRRDGDVANNSQYQLGIAAIQEDAELLEKATEYPKTAVYRTDPPGSGHYPDGSFLGHTDHPYNHGYGTNAIDRLSFMLQVVDGTQWDDISWADNLYEIAAQAHIGVLYDGTGICAFRGRGLSRYQTDVYGKAAKHLHWVIRLTKSAPDDVAQRLREMVKYHVQAVDSVGLREKVNSYRLTFTGDIELMSDLMNDDSISATPEQFTPKVFDNSDRQVVKTDDFAAEISGYSSRIATYESIGGEHRKGWHTSRGMTLLHTSDEQQFVEDRWATIDWYRLPGTTVVNKDLRPQAYESERSSEDWVGGSNLEDVGAFGMSLGPNYTDMSGTKSWLTIGGDQIVCLGTDISNTDEDGPTETTLINRKLNSNGDNTFVVDGSSQSTSLGWSDTLSDPSWAWLEDTGGYYFPDSSEYQAKREQRSGQWQNINVLYNEGGTTHSNNFLTLWQNHGTAPSNASYQYVLLPERTQSETEAYANNPPLDIEKHTSNVQAVRNTDHYAANFWEPASAGEVTTHHPASVVLEIDRENADSQSEDYPHTLSIAVADPTQEQDSLRVEIDRNVDAAAVDHPRVTVVNDINPFVFDVDLSGVHGDDITVDVAANIGGDPRRRPPLSFDEDAYLTAGESTEFPTTLENPQPDPLTNLQFDLAVPDSWDVELARVEGPASQSGSLPSGETATAVWNVRPPEGTTLDAYDVTASSSYEYDGYWAGPRSLEETLSVDWTDDTVFEVPEQQSLVIEETGEITATMTNPFPFDLEDVAATLTPPDDSDEWTIDAVSASTDVLSAGESAELTWEVTPPSWLPGTYDMELAVEYVRTNDSNSFVQTTAVTTALEEDDGTTPTSTTGTASTDADGPGFGVGGALTGLGGAGYLLHRRLTGTDTEGAADEDE